MIRALFNNRWFVIVLAVTSGLLIVRSIAAPFFTEPDFADAEDPEFYLGDFDEGGFDEGEQAPEAAPLPSGQSVLSGALNWTSDPRRDPFSRGTEPLLAESASIRPTTGSDSSQLPHLSGLVAGPKSLLAVLDDQIVREGDSVGVYRVRNIDSRGVRLSAPHGEHWLRVADMNQATTAGAPENPAEEEFSHGGEPGF